MDECLDGMFEKWFDKIGQASVEDKRKVETSMAETTYPVVLSITNKCSHTQNNH